MQRICKLRVMLASLTVLGAANKRHVSARGVPVLAGSMVIAISLGACGSAGPDPQLARPDLDAAPTAEALDEVESKPEDAGFTPTESPSQDAELAEVDPESGLPQALASLEITLEAVGNGFGSPLFVGHAGDGSGRVFVVEKTGRVVLLDEFGQPGETFLDLSDRIDASGYEQGLLGMAFHPQFQENGRLFVNYTDKQGDTVVSELRTEGGSGAVDIGSERQLLRIDQPASNHNGGHLAFGPDGFLYIGTGDGGAANDRFGNGQNLETLLGKMLRIDVDVAEGEGQSGDDGMARAYSIPESNPLIGREAEGYAPEIWAWGLRNPWRYSFDREDGALFIGDVGQNQREEIDWVPPSYAGVSDGQGLNFGWPIWEGFGCFQGNEDCTSREAQDLHRAPILEYMQDEAPGCSVTGGYVARGSGLNRDGNLFGTYIFGDYCSGLIFGARQDKAGRWHQRTLLDTSHGISSFGEDEAGNLYLTDLGSGVIYRIDEASR